MPLARTLTKKLKKGLSIRSSPKQEDPPPSPYRPTISLPLELFPDSTPPLKIVPPTPRQSSASVPRPSRTQSTVTKGPVSPTGWISSPPSPTTPTSSTSRQSLFDSPSSTSSRSSTESYFPKTSKERLVSFADAPIVLSRPTSSGSTSSSFYGNVHGDGNGNKEEMIEYEELKRRGLLRFSAAEYIREIEGTPMILVDGKLYL